jgi:hypothetical protein
MVDLDGADFTDPSARALAYRIGELIRQDARDDWRPDLLELAGEAWLEPAIARVREILPEVAQLADAQIAGLGQSMRRQLRESRLALELPELMALAQESDPDGLSQIKERIAQINRERVLLRREDADQPRGPAAVGKRAAIIPARFRMIPEEVRGGPNA